MLSDPFIANLVEMDSASTEAPATEVFEQLTNRYRSRSGAYEVPSEWPRKARFVPGLLRRHGPGLRQLGWTVEDDDGHNKANTVRWTLTPPELEKSKPEEESSQGRTGSRVKPPRDPVC